MNENELMSRLVASKAIMDKSSTIKRGQAQNNMPSAMVSDFDIPQAKYNIPQEFLQEQMSAPLLSSLPTENTKPVGVPTVDAIKKSKLPDEIKKLMIEHPIAQAQQQQQVTISNELIEKASRLMKTQDNNYIPESAKQPSTKPQLQTSSPIDYNRIQKMIEEAVEKALENNGLLVESVEKTGEVFSFRVGKHVFEGKVTKIKKLS